MTARELIELLQAEDPERIVVMSCDSDGNGFGPLAELSAENYHSGELGTDGEPAIVLWPVTEG